MKKVCILSFLITYAYHNTVFKKRKVSEDIAVSYLQGPRTWAETSTEKYT